MLKRFVWLLVAFVMLLSEQAMANSDVDGHWARGCIAVLADNGILSGDGQGNFMPDRIITRAEFICAVLRGIGAETNGVKVHFSDVSDSDFYAPYISRAAELGIVTGFADKTFRPNSALSREEAIVILSRSFGFLSGYTMDRFSDYEEITDGARSAFAYAYRKKIIAGYPDRTIRPKSSLTRGEAAVLLYKSMIIKPNEPGFVVGYPRLAEKGIYGCIRLEISTNVPCNVYYALYSPDMLGEPARNMINKPLVTTVAGNRQVTADIVCDVGSEYDVYLLAVTPDGRYSRIIKIHKTAPLPFTEGDGTKWSPYGIYTEQQLDAIRYFSDKAFSLKRDIELSGEWQPIEKFSGVLDGAGRRITGLKVSSQQDYAGFFGRITGGAVRNLTIDGFVSGKNNAGIFAGELGNAEISSCVATGYVSAVTNNAGGFFGESAGKIDNCLSAVYVAEASAFAGGIAGQNYGIIKNSISAAHTVSADMYAGGIAAVNVGGRVESSVAACINVFDMMMDNCGRITVNKKDAVSGNNYAYAGMKTTSETEVKDSANHNGEDITWEQLIDRKSITALLGWEEKSWSGGGRSENYLLPYPSGAAMPQLLAGISEYAPVRVGTAAELLGMIDNNNMHFMLINDIRFDSNIKWSTAAATFDVETGFSGSFDGGGYTIYDLKITAAENGQCGLFGMISGGVVRNVRISGAELKGGEVIGAIAAINYGSIENCTTDNLTVSSDTDTVYAGGIAGYNYGNIKNADAGGKLISTSDNSTIGGICAHNEGFIDNAAFVGTVTAASDEDAESVAGGICGYNGGGMIYNVYSSAAIKQSAGTMYSGGVCGILTDGELYKCSSRGTVVAEQTQGSASAYTGGIAGLAAGGLVMNSFSAADITAYAKNNYAGGICGFNEVANIQNVYATNTVMQVSGDSARNVYAGGICGYNEAGTVAQTVAVNPHIGSSGKTGRICGGGLAEQLYSNYAIIEMEIKSIGEGAFAGTNIGRGRLSAESFTRPLSNGGMLGWSDSVWTQASSVRYVLPVLRGVKHQESFGR